MIDNISSFMPSDFDKKITNYVQVIRNKNNEFNKRVYFISDIMKDIFKINSDFIDVEEGRIDIYFAGVMFETKVKITEETKKEAYREMKNYLEKKPNTVRCVITDGIIFEIYTPDEIKKYDPEKHNKLNFEKIFDIGTIDIENIGDYAWQDIFTNLYNMLYPKVSGLKPEPDIIVSRISDLVKRVYGQIDWNVADTVKYKAWKSYISIVFGGDPEEASEELFKKQSILYHITILMTAKVMHTKGSSKDIIKGRPFEGDGIINFVDADNFFDIFSENTEILSAINEELNIYDFSNLSEEVFRILYEKLVSPNTRHNLGEFYTPSCLAKILVDDVLTNKETIENRTILDPACGSGTFIRLAMERAKELNCNVTVVGFDINPIAIIIARANYLIAKKDDILQKAEPTTFIKIFLADALMPEWKNYTSSWLPHTKNMDDFEVTAKGNSFVCVDFNEIIGEGGGAPFSYNPEWDITDVENYITRMFDVINGKKEITDDMLENELLINKLKKLSEEGKDHVWAYILKNIYTPYYYRNKVDIVIGGPPWLTYKHVKNILRQQFLDKLYVHYNMQSGSQNKLNQDMVGFFICRSKEFLKDDNGKIAFIVTRSVMNASQYNGFRRGGWNLNLPNSKNKLGLSKIWDITERANPFNVPSCMILLEAIKNLEEYNIKKTIQGYIIDSENNVKNSIKNGKEITIEKNKKEKLFYINTTEKRSGISLINLPNIKKASEYKKLINRGAQIYPRPYFFVDIINKQRYNSMVSTLPKYGIEKNKRTSKGNFNFLFNDNYIPNLLIYDVIMGKNIQKFKVTVPYHAVIPVIDGKFIFKPDIKDGGYIFKLIDKDDLLVKIKDNNERNNYFKLLKDYGESFNEMEKDWENHRGNKFNIKGKSSAKMSVWGIINYQEWLSKPFNNTDKYMVVYNTSGKSVKSAVVNKDKTIVDSTAYYYNTNSKEDAYFMCGILNSDYTYNLINNYGIISSGTDIHRTPFEIPIPKYNADNPIHKKISNISYEISELKKDNKGANSKISELEETVKELFKENTNGIVT